MNASVDSAARAAESRALGKWAEEAVVRYLEEAGAQIVATNLRLGRLELDIVAREGRVVLVVEVRARGPGAWTRGFGSLGTAKRLRIRRAAERLWNRRYLHDPSVDRLRIDAASVTLANGQAIVEYVKAAF
ncbi:MAG TPA: YraN family protein [Polyangiaceae bacterium]|nr:YraN family protein [Polyangiaceae bacterium]